MARKVTQMARNISDEGYTFMIVSSREEDMKIGVESH